MSGRAWYTVEVGGRRHTATRVDVPSHMGAWQVVLTKLDGTDPVVVTGIPAGGGAFCSACGMPAGGPCPHVRAVVQVGMLAGSTLAQPQSNRVPNARPQQRPVPVTVPDPQSGFVRNWGVTQEQLPPPRPVVRQADPQPQQTGILGFLTRLVEVKPKDY